MSVLDIVVFVLPGLAATFSILGSAVIVGLALAILAGLGSLSSQRLVRVLCLTYIEVFRGTSFLVQLFYFYYVLPLLGVSLAPFWVGTLALGLNAGSYGAELTRGALLAVASNQRDAIIALNIPRVRAFYRIILPQAAARMILPMGNLLLEMMKSTPLLALVSIADLLYRGQMLIALNGQAPIVYGVLMVIYIAFGWPLARGVALLDACVTRRWGGAHV
ncbi:amino acid ABC transporter permease [Acuticoccus mangrovi]|uniref:ABC transporter permease subunit n=1 Tax=Acuticoccus mangrovi TaxID=2796142 RepID=A0A934IMG5_9HYPH|nr:ABC transporter permease subunit [Acuticoccus mangrovi]MBJ3775325.1 ABC transporter permease subunit [Acuticoccus mangrovi]